MEDIERWAMVMMFTMQKPREIRIVLDETSKKVEKFKKKIGEKDGKAIFALQSIEVEEVETTTEEVIEYQLLTTGQYIPVRTEKTVVKPKQKTVDIAITVPAGLDVREILADEGEPLSYELICALKKNASIAPFLQNYMQVLWGPKPSDLYDTMEKHTEEDIREENATEGGNATSMQTVTTYRKKVPEQNFTDAKSTFGEHIFAIIKELNERSCIPDIEDNSLRFLDAKTWRKWEETWSPFDATAPRDKVGEDKVKQLGDALKAKALAFKDPFFPPDDYSLFAAGHRATPAGGAVDASRPDQQPFLAAVPVVQWRRAAEIGDTSKPVQVFSQGSKDNISPNDVAQGNLGDCYFLAAIASCADKGDQLIRDLVIEDYLEQGLFGVKFFINGRWRTVVIDDCFPCKPAHAADYRKNPATYKGGWTPVFASPKVHADQDSNTREIWPLILEKAWAKLFRSFEATAGGSTSDAHHYLTGGFNTRVLLGKDAADAAGQEKAWAALRGAVGPGVADPPFCSTSMRRKGLPKAAKQLQSELGLITGHAYSALRVVEALGQRLIEIRNPWGSTEWKGRFSDTDRESWTQELQKAADYDPNKDGTGEDGSFMMHWDDFVTYFEDVEICDPRILRDMTTKRGATDSKVYLDGAYGQFVAGKTAGGMPRCSLYKYNPRYTLRVEEGREVYLTLYQPDKRLVKFLAEGETGLRMRVFIQGQEKPVLDLDQWARFSSVKLPVTPKQDITLVVAASGPGFEGHFVLTAAGKDCSLVPQDLITPTEADAAKMAKKNPYLCACGCGVAVLGKSFYPMPQGPVIDTCYESSKGKSYAY